MTHIHLYPMLRDIESLCRQVQKIPTFKDRVQARIKSLNQAVEELDKIDDKNVADLLARESTAGQAHGLVIALEIFVSRR